MTEEVKGTHVPRLSLGELFLRFLRFGALAWGGPVAQIGMIKHELVDEERWISPDRFHRVLAVYQVLPGPEAHELCVYFGMLSRGRWGGVLAGLGFMLPGFLSMLVLSWLYVRYGLGLPAIHTVFAAVQAAVLALIVRAVWRIGTGALKKEPWLWGIAAGAAAAQWAGIHFAAILVSAGVFYVIARNERILLGALASLVLVAGSAVLVVFAMQHQPLDVAGAPSQAVALQKPTTGALLTSGLKAGLLTFGGAYTVIPFLQRDAVVAGGWLTNDQFLDGIALSGILPAPLVIFGTFIGYVGAGFAGALAMTLGIFLPAFAITLVGHDHLERVVHDPRIHHFLEGVTAGVVGLIAATAAALLRIQLTEITLVLVFGLALAALVKWHARMAVPVVIGAAALVGLFLHWGSQPSIW